MICVCGQSVSDGWYGRFAHEVYPESGKIDRHDDERDHPRHCGDDGANETAENASAGADRGNERQSARDGMEDECAR